MPSAAQPLSRSAEVARQVLGEALAGVVVSDRYGAYSWLPLQRRQLCWAYIKRDSPPSRNMLRRQCAAGSEASGAGGALV